MYEKDITDFEKPHTLGDCPHCGLILTLEPCTMVNFERGLLFSKPPSGSRYSYRVLRCKNQHMFIVIGAYVSTFDFPFKHHLRRFEILCDEDVDFQRLHLGINRLRLLGGVSSKQTSIQQRYSRMIGNLLKTERL